MTSLSPSFPASNTPLKLLLCDSVALKATSGPGPLPGTFCPRNPQGWLLLVFKEMLLLSLRQPLPHPVPFLAPVLFYFLPFSDMVLFISFLIYLLSPSLKVRAALMAQVVKNLPASQETQVWSLGQEDPCRRKWQLAPVFLPGKSHGQRSLVGNSPWGCKEWDMSEHHPSHTHTQT